LEFKYDSHGIFRSGNVGTLSKARHIRLSDPLDTNCLSPSLFPLSLKSLRLECSEVLKQGQLPDWIEALTFDGPLWVEHGFVFGSALRSLDLGKDCDDDGYTAFVLPDGLRT